MAKFVDKELARIRALVGQRGQVLGAVSGGVDSTVAAKLMHEAIGDRFHAVLVDNGVMHLHECEQVKKTLTEYLGINLAVVDASDLFLKGLKGITDNLEKRGNSSATPLLMCSKRKPKILKRLQPTLPKLGRSITFS
jgi:GMP synthase (glutamine-hydrolysing)